MKDIARKESYQYVCASQNPSNLHFSPVLASLAERELKLGRQRLIALARVEGKITDAKATVLFLLHMADVHADFVVASSKDRGG